MTDTEEPEYQGPSLEEQVDALKARHALRDSMPRAAGIQLAERSGGEDGAAAGDIAVAIAGVLAKIPPASEVFMRENAWKQSIVPRLVACGVPLRYRYDLAAAWNCRQQQRVFDLCLKMFTGTGVIVALVGERGTGKTTLAAQLIVSRAWEDYAHLMDPLTVGFLWRYMPYRKLAELISRFKALYGDFGTVDGDSLTAARNTFCGTPLAIVDELHDCEDLKMKDRVLTDFIDRRYSRMCDTLLISNQTKKQFEETTSDSVLSRISEHGIIVECTWGSWRNGERRKLARHA